MTRRRRLEWLTFFAVIIVTVTLSRSLSVRVAAQAPQRFGIGRPATPAEISALDIDIGPDGAGLPRGAAPRPTARRSTRRAARGVTEELARKGRR
jgi:hypothetical protein